MSKYYKILKMLLAICAIVTLLLTIGIGCKATAATTTAAATTAAATTAAATTAAATTAAAETTSEEPITLNLWTWSVDVLTQGAEELAGDILKQSHPNVSLNRVSSGYDVFWTQFKAAVAGGEVPDIMTMQPSRATGLVSENALLDLRPLIEADAEWNEWIEPVRWSGEGVKNKEFWYGENMDQNFLIPVTVQTYVLMYNDKIYTNGFPKTLDEWYVEAKRINSEGFYPIIVPWVEKSIISNCFVILSAQLDPKAKEKAESGEIKWTDDIFVETMKAIKGMWDNDVISKDAFTHGFGTDMYELFMAGKAGAIGVGLEVIAATFEAKDMDMSTVHAAYMPLVKAGANYTHISGFSGCYAAPAQGKHTDLAAEYLKILSSPEVRKWVYENGGPTPKFEGEENAKPMTKYPELWKEFTNLYNANPTIYYVFSDADIDLAVAKAVTDVCLDTLSIEDALAEIQKVADSNK